MKELIEFLKSTIILPVIKHKKVPAYNIGILRWEDIKNERWDSETNENKTNEIYIKSRDINPFPVSSYDETETILKERLAMGGLKGEIYKKNKGTKKV